MSFFDQTDNIGKFNTKHGDGFVIHFVHVATRDTAHFKAFLTNWEDQIKQNWKSYETVGRMDPIMIYARTGRQITFSIDIPSSSEEEALLNMMQIERLMRMCYPTFQTAETKTESKSRYVSEEEAKQNRKDAIKQKVEELTGKAVFEVEGELQGGADDTTDEINEALKQASEEVNKESQSEEYRKKVAEGLIANPTFTTTISNSFSYRTSANMVSPPLMRIKFANWISDTNIDQDYSSNNDNSVSGPGGEKGSGLYGVIENVKFLPDLSSDGGGFYACEAYGESGKSYLIPKLLKLDIMFTVLHASDLGYTAGGGTAQRTPGFPYNAEKIYNSFKDRKNRDLVAEKAEAAAAEKYKNDFMKNVESGAFSEGVAARGSAIDEAAKQIGDMYMNSYAQGITARKGTTDQLEMEIKKQDAIKESGAEEVKNIFSSVSSAKLSSGIPEIPAPLEPRSLSTPPSRGVAGVDINKIVPGTTYEPEVKAAIDESLRSSSSTGRPSSAASSSPTAPPSVRIGPQNNQSTQSSTPKGRWIRFRTETNGPFGKGFSYEDRWVEE